MKKKVILAVGVVVMALTVLAACETAIPEPADPSGQNQEFQLEAVQIR